MFLAELSSGQHCAVAADMLVAAQRLFEFSELHRPDGGQLSVVTLVHHQLEPWWRGDYFFR